MSDQSQNLKRGDARSTAVHPVRALLTDDPNALIFVGFGVVDPDHLADVYLLPSLDVDEAVCRLDAFRTSGWVRYTAYVDVIEESECCEIRDTL